VPDELFSQFRLVAFKPSDLVLIGTDHARAGRFHDAIEKRVDLLFGLIEALLCRRDHFVDEGLALCPGTAEHVRDHVDQSLAGLDRLEDCLEVAFELVARDGLAVAGTALGLAQIIRVSLGVALGPGTAKRLVAITAQDEATQGEVIADVLARRELGNTLPAFLNRIERFERDQPVMLAFQPVELIALAADVAGIERLGEDFGHALLRDDALAVARERGKALKEALDLGLGLEPAGSVSLKGITDDGCERLVRHQHLAASLLLFVAIADGRIVNPIAVLHAGLHLLGNLPSVLLALKRALGGDDGLDELALGRVVELEVQALDHHIARPERVTQIEEGTRIAAGPFQIIEDHDEALSGLGVEEGKQSLHAGPLHVIATTREGVREDRRHLKSERGRTLAASRFLGLKAMAVIFLGGRGDPAIDDRLSVTASIGHGLLPLDGLPHRQNHAGARPRCRRHPAKWVACLRRPAHARQSAG